MQCAKAAEEARKAAAAWREELPTAKEVQMLRALQAEHSIAYP